MERIKLDPLVNQLVRFKLHELSETKEAVIRAFEDRGYGVEGGSLGDYLKAADSDADVQYLDVRRIHWIQPSRLKRGIDVAISPYRSQSRVAG